MSNIIHFYFKKNRNQLIEIVKRNRKRNIQSFTMDSLAKIIKYNEIRTKNAVNYYNKNSAAQYYYL